MKKYFYIFTLFCLQVFIAACTDSEIYDSTDNGSGSSIKIILNVPVDNGKTRGLTYGPDADPIEGESTIKDVYVLAFYKENGSFAGKLATRMLSDKSLIATVNTDEIELNELTVMVLTNLEDLENGSALIDYINNLPKGSTNKAGVLNKLKYTFSDKWVLSDRPLPMWGETDLTPVEGEIVPGSIDLYRAVSKINVVVNLGKGIKKREGKEVFKLKSVRVYYARTSGLAGSLHAPDENNPEGSNTIIVPSIPQNVEFFPRYKEGGAENNLLFEDNMPEGNYAIENKIYVPESDQKQTSEPMCLVIGGYYMESDQETYYRVDFKEKNKGDKFYNAIRNHIYTFNVNNVTRPGTDEPDPALDHVVVGMEVTILEWTPVWMRGIGGQYTLEVEAGGLILESTNTAANDLWVKSTHNNGWKISEQSGNWFTVTPNSDNSGVVITPTKNEGGQRRGSFVITSGNLNKLIMVRQKGIGTANCYVVSDNGSKMPQNLIVTVKGNGEEGLMADGHPLQDQEPNLDPDDVKIIWQTAEGLVTLNTDGKGNTIINENGIVQFKIDLTKQNSDIKKSNYPDLQGGNALIGAFKNGKIIWTWHLWVCPDLDTDKDGFIDEDELTACEQGWTTGFGYGYKFLDRYLGALTSKPGLSSLGLLYQWGRKDPFIGAASISESQTGNRMETFNLDNYTWKNHGSDMSIDQTIENPTTLINGKITGTDYSFLWGTNKGFTTVRDAGNKTIYDPCPAGYRVPPVSSIVFNNGYYTSEKNNYNSNVIWWPNAETSTYVPPAYTDSYGFWLNCNSAASKPSGVNQWSIGYYGNTKNNVSVADAAWLPLAGVYDGDITSLANVDKQNSLTVNSIIWTNSSIQAGSEIRPGALFLHGREIDDYGNGRHLHRLIETENDLYAKTTHAGSVRCIKDTKASIQNAIRVPEKITLGNTKGSYVEDFLTSITESWEVVDPGAMWFVMTPDQGTAGSQQPIKLTAMEENTVKKERSAILKVKFSDGSTKNIKVTQRANASTKEISFRHDAFGDQAVYMGTKDFTWESSPSTGLRMVQRGGYIYISPLSKNTTDDIHTWTITVKNSKSNDIIYYIDVTQNSQP